MLYYVRLTSTTAYYNALHCTFESRPYLRWPPEGGRGGARERQRPVQAEPRGALSLLPLLVLLLLLLISSSSSSSSISSIINIIIIIIVLVLLLLLVYEPTQPSRREHVWLSICFAGQLLFVLGAVRRTTTVKQCDRISGPSA